jgi:hypothetical protein
MAYSLRPAVSQPTADSPLAFSFKMGGDTTFATGADTNASFATAMEYNFYKTYGLGAEYSFYQPYTQFDDYIYNGANDLSFYLADNKLWYSRRYGVTITAKLSGTLPTSQSSQEASLYWATGQVLIFKNEFSDRESITYTTSANEYSVKYIEAWVDPDTGKIIYNTRFDWNNRLTYSLEFVKNWKVLFAGGVRLYNNYNDSTYPIYRLSGGTSAQLTKSTTLDIALTTNMKDADADKTWFGPPVSGHFFDGKGTQIAFSMTIKI